MAHSHVRTLDEWMALPELLVPTDSQSQGKGAVYRVLNVGIFLAEPAECERKNLSAEANLALGKCYLPTAFIQEQDSAEKLYRLPLPLNNWAAMVALLADSEHAIPLPCDVEFCRKGLRIDAEIR